jgi:hypothetical protein
VVVASAVRVATAPRVAAASVDPAETGRRVAADLVARAPSPSKNHA